MLDRPRRRAYAALGPRTSETAIAELDRKLGYRTLSFPAVRPDGRAIYHTNVMMSLGERYALVCPETVPEPHRAGLLEDIEQAGRTIISVDYDQLRRFACNILELSNGHGGSIVAMSSAARENLRPDQLRMLEDLAGPIFDAPIPTIEQIGGGSVRCMLAEINLPRLAA